MKVRVNDLKNNLEYIFEDLSIEDFKNIWIPNSGNFLKDTMLNKDIKFIRGDSVNKNFTQSPYGVSKRLDTLYELLPDTKFESNCRSIFTTLGDKKVKVKYQEMNSKNKTWSFQNVSAGNLLLLIKGNNLDAIFVAKSNWISISGTLSVSYGSARYSSIKLNTPRVIKNLKQI